MIKVYVQIEYFYNFNNNSLTSLFDRSATKEYYELTSIDNVDL